MSGEKVEDDAKRCVILAIKVPTIINFEEVLDLDAVKYLQGKKKEVFDFISLFTETDTKTFSAQVKKFSQLMQEERLTNEDVLKKKQYVQICSLQLEISNHKYS